RRPRPGDGAEHDQPGEPRAQGGPRVRAAGGAGSGARGGDRPGRAGRRESDPGRLSRAACVHDRRRLRNQLRSGRGRGPRGRSRALDPRWRAAPAAQAWLWKDHTAAEEAAAITETARRCAPEYLSPIGGTYSSEWFWSKIWHCRKVAPDVFAAAASWVELADFVPAVLAGVTHPGDIVRGVCAAGHKALYSEAWGGLPAHEFLCRLDPELGRLRDRLYTKAYSADRAAGALAREWAETFGLRTGIPIAMGAFDAHYGAVGAGVRVGTFVKIIGTSTCDIAIADARERVPDIPGICGIVPGSVLPGYYGIEAGQSAVGDLLRWWVEVVCQGRESLHAELSREAARLRAGASGLLALDWNNGNRTILVDPRLTGLIVGQTLHTT